MKLSTYLSIRLVMPMLVVTAILAYAGYYYYLIGLDDTAAFYLFEDAQDYQDSRVEVISDFRFVSADLTKFDKGLTFDPNAVENPNQVFFQQDSTYDRYFLMYQDTSTQAPVYVVHSFKREDTFDIQPTLLFIVAVSILSYLFWLINTVFCVKRHTQQFIKAIKDSTLDKQIPIQEFAEANQLMYQSQQEKYAAIEREKNFATFLSHEIRQPITVLGHAISRFDQIDDIPLSALTLIDNITTSQQKLVNVSSAILSLWQSQSYCGDERSLLQQFTQWQQKNDLLCEIEIDNQALDIIASSQHIQLLLDVINDNFKKHGSGNLKIHVTANSFSFSNQCKTQEQHESSFGVGQFILAALALNFGCDLNIHKTNGLYCVEFKMK